MASTENLTVGVADLPTSHRFSAAVLFLVVFFGVLGNTFVATTIFRQRRLLNINYYYQVFHLAICDIVVLLSYLDEAGQLWEPTFTILRSTIICKFWTPFQLLFFTASPYLMVVIGIFCYRIVVYPFKPATERWKLNIIILMVYVAALLCVTPYIWVLKYDPILGCFKNWPKYMFNVSVLFVFIINYFIPTIFLIILYSKICFTLAKQNNMISSYREETIKDKNAWNTISKHRRNVKTFIVSVTVVVCYAVSALPVQLWWILIMTGKITGTPFENNWKWMFFFYIIGTSALNPVIYGMIDNNFLAIFRKWKKKISKSKNRINIISSI